MMRRILRSLRQWFARTGKANGRAMSPAALRKLAGQLERTLEREVDCDDVLHLLDQYAEAALRDEDLAQLMPLVAQHIELCADCREEFEALMRILKAAPA